MLVVITIVALIEILLCIPVTILTSKLRQKLPFSIDEIFLWLEAVLPAVIILFPFYISGKLNRETLDLGGALFLVSVAFGAGVIFVFRWICTLIRNREETGLQIRYAVIWMTGIITALCIKVKNIFYYIWLTVFMPINAITIADKDYYIHTATFIVIACVMTGISLFIAWGYRREK